MRSLLYIVCLSVRFAGPAVLWASWRLSREGGLTALDKVRERY
jgi:hypothetical protein